MSSPFDPHLPPSPSSREALQRLERALTTAGCDGQLQRVLEEFLESAVPELVTLRAHDYGPGHEAHDRSLEQLWLGCRAVEAARSRQVAEEQSPH